MQLQTNIFLNPSIQTQNNPSALTFKPQLIPNDIKEIKNQRYQNNRPVWTQEDRGKMQKSEMPFACTQTLERRNLERVDS